MMRLILPVLAVLSTAPLPAVAQQESRCGTLEQVEAILAKDGEAQVQAGLGQMNGNHLSLIYATPNGDTWTAVVVGPTGVACVVDYGADWQARVPVPDMGEGL